MATKPLERPPEKVKNTTWERWVNRFWPVNGALQEISVLDGLRAIAVVFPIVEHVVWAMINRQNISTKTAETLWGFRLWESGWVGVELFFVLSGFLLFMPYARTIYGLKKMPGTGKFYARRALRILPGYWVALILIVLIFEQQFLQSNNLYNLGLHFIMLQNWSFETHQAINAPFWTMAVEVQFYLLLPLLGILLVKLARARRFKLMLAVAVLIAGLRPLYGLLWTVLKNKAPGAFEHVLLFEVFGYLCVFGMGMALSLFYVGVVEARQLKLEHRTISRFSKLAGVIGIATIIIWSVAFQMLPPLQKISLFVRELIIGPALAGIILGCLLGWRSWNNFLSLPLMRFIGIISYSIYIWNLVLAQYFVVPLAEKTGSDLATLVVALVLMPLVCIPVAFIFYHFVERPFIAKRREQH